jgi:hypothetical protein
MMNYKVATTFSEVLDAWGLVYHRYHDAGLIKPNDYNIFTFPEYLSNNSAVLIGGENNSTVCTISAVIDGEKRLPLENYYADELNRMRDEGKKLIEIGLHADSRNRSSISDITDLMAGIARFGVQTNHHDFIIGVHPRRVSFYQTVFGFKPVGPVKSYQKLDTAPVILLHACGTNQDVNSLYINNKIYSDPAGFDFTKRFMFNPHNQIPTQELNQSVENFFKTIWTSKILKAA